MFKATAYFHTDKELGGKPMMFRSSANFNTEAERDEAAKQFPKYLKVKKSKLYTEAGMYYSLSFAVYFKPNQVTGAKNETAERRLKKFLEKAEVEYVKSPATNAYDTLDEFLNNL